MQKNIAQIRVHKRRPINWLLSGRYLRFEKTQVEPWEKTARPVIHYYLCYLLMKGVMQNSLEGKKPL